MKTTNYEMFKFFKSNRPVKKSNVNNLKESIKKYGFIESRPILVNEKYEVIDGQNRLIACKELNVPVYYSIINSNGKSEELIIALNRHQQNWKLAEYVHHWAAKGVPFYEKLLKFSEDHKSFGLNPSISICTNQTDGGRFLSKVKNGLSFKFSDDAYLLAEYILKFRDLGIHKEAQFIRAVCHFYRKTNAKDKERLLDRMLSIKRQPGKKEYLILFENIVNKGKDEKHKIVLTSI